MPLRRLHMLDLADNIARRDLRMTHQYPPRRYQQRLSLYDAW